MGIVTTKLLQGTLDLLILRVLSGGALHGWAIAQRIRLVSNDALRVNQGSLYPALQRLEERGLVAAEWATSEQNRRARFYRLTRAGRRQLDAETANWQQFAGAVGRVLETS
jgi:PadR family transcriptional regulator, regulatory protein PadR